MGRGGAEEGAGEAGRPSVDQVSCEEALTHLFEYLDGELGTELQEGIHDHLELCQECYPFFNFERLFLDYIQERGLDAHCDEDFVRKVRTLLSELD